jgi:hypothetical protein
MSAANFGSMPIGRAMKIIFGVGLIAFTSNMFATSNISTTGIDLDVFFAPLGAPFTAYPSDTGYMVNGTDIRNRYVKLSDGYPSPSPTGIKVNGTDLNQIFAAYAPPAGMWAWYEANDTYLPAYWDHWYDRSGNNRTLNQTAGFNGITYNSINGHAVSGDTYVVLESALYARPSDDFTIFLIVNENIPLDKMRVRFSLFDEWGLQEAQLYTDQQADPYNATAYLMGFTVDSGSASHYLPGISYPRTGTSLQYFRKEGTVVTNCRNGDTATMWLGSSALRGSQTKIKIAYGQPLAEIIIYWRALTPDEIMRAVNYFRAKYAFTF